MTQKSAAFRQVNKRVENKKSRAAVLTEAGCADNIESPP
jgi:hypothetical protein